ncbi:MAG: KUP/HAK/KT family potassium transporter, partial [Saprospiraceae bacterium]|nr:KUP/HAK/KT family potassium transporter [Saprospiraceae bacterium]
IELSFFIANIAKIRERWMFLFFEIFIFSTMYIWYYARKINNRHVGFVELKQYVTLLKDLGEDKAIAKFATHLIYLTKADNFRHIEEKIVRSIFAKKPKRADVYWFLHLNRTDDPYTLEYDLTEMAEGQVIRVDINIGFRIQPRTELYFKKILEDLATNQVLQAKLPHDGSTRYNPEPDFKFVVIEKFLSAENDLPLRESLLLNGYFILKRMGTSDERAFGLDKSDVLVENIPLIYQRAEHILLSRK